MNTLRELSTESLMRSAMKDRIEALKEGVMGGIYSPGKARVILKVWTACRSAIHRVFSNRWCRWKPRCGHCPG